MQLTRSMALEYADKGLRINVICPGGVWTPMVDNFIERAEDSGEAQKFMESLHPMGRLAESSEVAEAVLFLCSEKVMFNTGFRAFHRRRHDSQVIKLRGRRFKRLFLKYYLRRVFEFFSGSNLENISRVVYNNIFQVINILI